MAVVAARQGRRPVALGVLCALLFLTFLDNTIVSVVLGDIQTDLHAGVSALQWVVGAYALAFASLMLACGMIGDELGRKRVMLSGVAVFCAGSVVCALAPNPDVLIAGRAVMGLGAAASEPGTLSMLRQLYTDEVERDRAIGVWAATSGMALAVGPVLGAVIVGVWDWRAIFWLNLAFGLGGLIVAALVLPESADPDAGRVDTAGTLLGAGALAALLFAVLQGENAGFGAAPVALLFGVSALMTAAFIWREQRATRPLLDLRYLHVPGFTVGVIGAFCTYFATFALYFFTALYLNEVVGDNGYRLAGVFAPMTVLLAASAMASGRLAPRLGARNLVVAGCLLFGTGLLLTSAALTVAPDNAALVASLSLAGLGIGITVVPITSSVLDAVPAARSGMAASAANTSREVGALTGVAVLGAIVNARLRSDLTAHLRHLQIPLNFQAIVIRAVETGGVPAQPGAAGAGARRPLGIRP